MRLMTNLTWLGAEVRLDKGSVRVQAKKIKGAGDYDLIRKMRGSICIMGPRSGPAAQGHGISLPGGCVIGARPINLHLKGFEALGAKVTIASGYVQASAKRLKGSAIFLGGRSGSTVLGTANVIMAAVLAEGVTVIESAACEPEVVDLVTFLNTMGARISWRREPDHHNHRGKSVARRRAPGDSRSNRGGDLRDRGRGDQWRGHVARHAA